MCFVLVVQPVRHCLDAFRVRKLNAPHWWQLNCQALSHFSRALLVFEFEFIDSEFVFIHNEIFLAGSLLIFL
jgi:hypothetical protein